MAVQMSMSASRVPDFAEQPVSEVPAQETRPPRGVTSGGMFEDGQDGQRAGSE